MEVEGREKNQHHHHQLLHHHIPMNNFSRDLLNKFMAANNRHHQHHQHHHHLPLPVVKPEQIDEEEEIELSLGLSLNGRFGVDKTPKKIKRTISIPEFVNPVKDEEMGFAVPMASGSPLVRTCSLPTETEEEWRKRKESQTQRRLEARKKRSEKQRILKALRERNRALSEDAAVAVAVEEGNNPVEQVAGLGRTLSLTSRVGGLGLNGDKDKDKEKGCTGSLPPPSPSQGSIGFSQGSGSSGNSETDCQQGQGTALADARIPIGANLLPEGENSGKNAVRNEATKQSAPENKTKEIVKNLLEDMPCVSTKGGGPNGKKIEGFLYRYAKGEEVRIVCVCHGSFLTPSEFVKHAGGPDVPNPLKHIVVSTSSV